MIKNERQYRITRAQVEKFEHAIADLVSASDTLGVHPVLEKAELDALRGQLGDLEAELEEYQSLKSGKRQVLTLDSFDDLPRALGQGRIAAGLSQQELAAKLGIKEQQVQRYEASDYQSASLARVAEVVRALGLRVQTDLF
ncbi:MAG: helix-turn-helix transcriptional regulator [Bryobacterales bacterium]|nr:helix-turn-helix transcriptional regulator [Bryobacterales bacterium]